jgi:hypothetical protein
MQAAKAKTAASTSTTAIISAIFYVLALSARYPTHGCSPVENEAEFWSLTVLVSSLNPAYVGQPVTFTISVVPSFSGTPTGTAILYKGSTKFATLALSNGLVSCGLPV